MLLGPHCNPSKLLDPISTFGTLIENPEISAGLLLCNFLTDETKVVEFLMPLVMKIKVQLH
jgi:hypothetical protein